MKKMGKYCVESRIRTHASGRESMISKAQTSMREVKGLIQGRVQLIIIFYASRFNLDTGKNARDLKIAVVYAAAK